MTDIIKTASAHWQGSFKQGKGSISTESGALKEQPYGANTRFEGQAGTNPEELIGAAHAACYAMALSVELGKQGADIASIDTQAEVTLSKQDDGFAVTRIKLSCKAAVQGIDADTFQQAANRTKEACPISKLIQGGSAQIELEASLI